MTAFVGQFKIPSVDIPAKVGTSAWGIPRGISAYTSSDVSLFSSSLPVLPHEKCMCKLLLQDIANTCGLE
jgi:hypothetical protein